MVFKREDEIKIAGKQVYVIDVITYQDNQYIYVQEIEDDELVEKYRIYMYDAEKNAMVVMQDKEKVDILLKLFAENIQKDLGEE